jgi:hypothetical protein
VESDSEFTRDNTDSDDDHVGTEFFSLCLTLHCSHSVDDADNNKEIVTELHAFLRPDVGRGLSYEQDH